MADRADAVEVVHRVVEPPACSRMNGTTKRRKCAGEIIDRDVALELRHAPRRPQREVAEGHLAIDVDDLVDPLEDVEPGVVDGLEVRSQAPPGRRPSARAPAVVPRSPASVSSPSIEVGAAHEVAAAGERGGRRVDEVEVEAQPGVRLVEHDRARPRAFGVDPDRVLARRAARPRARRPASPDRAACWRPAGCPPAASCRRAGGGGPRRATRDRTSAGRGRVRAAVARDRPRGGGRRLGRCSHMLMTSPRRAHQSR